jgi:hypothetical protein
VRRISVSGLAAVLIQNLERKEIFYKEGRRCLSIYLSLYRVKKKKVLDEGNLIFEVTPIRPKAKFLMR